MTKQHYRPPRDGEIVTRIFVHADTGEHIAIDDPVCAVIDKVMAILQNVDDDIDVGEVLANVIALYLPKDDEAKTVFACAELMTVAIAVRGKQIDSINNPDCHAGNKDDGIGITKGTA